MKLFFISVISVLFATIAVFAQAPEFWKKAVAELESDKSKYMVVAGTNIYGLDKSSCLKGCRFGISYGEDFINLQVKKKSLKVSVKIVNELGERVIDMTNSDYGFNDKDYFRNYDDSAVEIVDKSGIVWFNMKKHKNTIYINGIFLRPTVTIVVTEDGSFDGPNFKYDKEKSYLKYAAKIKKIFVYQGKGSLHKRAKV